MTIMSLFRRGSSSAEEVVSTGLDTAVLAVAVPVAQPTTDTDTGSDSDNSQSTTELVLSSDTQFDIIHRITRR